MLALAAAILASAPALAQTLTVKTARGPVEVPQNSETVIVYDITGVHTLDALGIAPVGVTDRHYVDHLADVAAEAEVAGDSSSPTSRPSTRCGPT